MQLTSVAKMVNLSLEVEKLQEDSEEGKLLEFPVKLEMIVAKLKLCY